MSGPDRGPIESAEPRHSVAAEVLAIVLPQLHAGGLKPVTLSDLLGVGA